jgi:F0F1-type ATP synthase assembly protein I
VLSAGRPAQLETGTREARVQGPPDPQEMGYYLTLGQIGLEMVVPVVAGLVIENYLGGRPWGIIAGAAFGLIGGFTHMLILLNRQNDRDASKQRRDSQ